MYSSILVTELTIFVVTGSVCSQNDYIYFQLQRGYHGMGLTGYKHSPLRIGRVDADTYGTDCMSVSVSLSCGLGIT
jgi:hypothetical protein